MTPSECPVRFEALQVSAASANFSKAMRRFKRSLRRCYTCEHEGSCPILGHVHTQIDAAINEITEEWHLARTP